ncbi:MAG: DUF1573 domain-containing protein [Candidatus Hydrogenedentes bacterium]|nr:DUF1573 domain-containing protein [Candidatus Hydrogenedentota bacterium]
MMKSSAAVILLVVCASGLLQACEFAQNEAPESESRIAPSPPRLDFGIRHDGVKIDFALVVANANFEPLRISEITTSCGCTTAGGTYVRAIEPQSVVSIPMSWTLPTGDGAKKSNIVVTFDDQNENPRHYELIAEVPETCPREVAIGFIGPPPALYEGEFYLRTFPGEESIQVVSTETSTSALTVSSIASNEDVVRVSFSFSADAPRDIRESITLNTNDQIQPVKSVLLTGRVVDYVELSKREIYLGCAKEDYPRVETVEVLASEGFELVDSNFSTLEERGLHISLGGADMSSLSVSTTPAIFAKRQRGTVQREIATFSWRVGVQQGEAELAILFMVL